MARSQEIPAYLQSEEAFKSVANYTQRANIVRGNERQYWVDGRYTGETQQNLALMRFLQDNPKARAEWERVLGISREGLRWLRKEYEGKHGLFGRLFGRTSKPKSIQEVAAGKNYFAKETRSSGEINLQWGKAFEASEKERVFMDINNELVRAWRKDIGGRLITGGLLGMLQSRTSNLNKALRTIEAKYPGMSSRIIIQLQTFFQNLDGLTRAHAAGATSRKGKELLMSALSPFGFERTSTLQRIQSDPNFTGRLGAFLQTAIGFAISSAMGSPSIYLGSINTGIKMKDVRNPNKDVISYALFNASYNTILQDNDREHGRYNRMLGDNAITAETRGTLEAYRASVSGNVGEYQEAADEGFKANGGHVLFRVLREIFTETEREIIVKRDVPLEEKYRAIDNAIIKLWNKRQTERVENQIATLQRLKTLYGRREQGREHVERDLLPAKYQEALRVMNRFATYDEIKDFYMPKSTKAWMKVYLEWGNGYAARDKNLLMYLWDSVDTPGFQRFIKAVASGRTREFNDWTLQQEGHDRIVAGKKTEYGRDISSIRSGAELSQYLDSVEWGRRLASIYAAQINNLGKNIHVDPDEIVRASQEAEYGVASRLFNSWRNSNDINTLRTHKGNGWIINVQATDTSEGYPRSVILRIGVKPNCSNLLISDITGERWYSAANLPSDLNFRIPLTISIPKSKPDVPSRGRPGWERTQPGVDTAPGSDGQIQGPITYTGTVRPDINAAIGATPGSQTTISLPNLPGGTVISWDPLSSLRP